MRYSKGVRGEQNVTRNVRLEKLCNRKMSIMKIHPANNNDFTTGKIIGSDKETENKASSKENSLTLANLLKEFRDDTTLHGVKHVSRKRNIFRGIVWGLAVTSMAALLGRTMYDLHTSYYSYPTLSRLKNERANELIFPALTICNLSPYNKSLIPDDSDMDLFLKATSNIAGMTTSINFSDPAYASLHEEIEPGWLQSVSFRLNTTLLACYFEGNYYGCNELFEEHVTEMGLCFQFNANPSKVLRKSRYQGSNRGLKFYIFVDQKNYVHSTEMGAGIKIMVHGAHEEPNIRDNGYLISPGFVSYIGLQLTQYEYLPAPFKAFGEDYCLDTEEPGFQNPLKFHRTYSYYGCIRECKRQYMVQACNCQMPIDAGNDTLCSFEKYWMCYGMKQWFFEGDHINDCNCLRPCSFKKYSTVISSSYFPADIYQEYLSNLSYTNLRNDYIELRIFFDTLHYTTVEQIAKYEIGSILATLGGQMGIFLGASLLTISELLELFIFSAYMAARRLMNRNNREQRTRS